MGYIICFSPLLKEHEKHLCNPHSILLLLKSPGFGEGEFDIHINCICLHINVLVQQLSKSYAVNAVEMVYDTAAQDTRYFYAEIQFI